MARTIIYPAGPIAIPDTTDDEPLTFGGPARTKAEAAPKEDTPDGYAEKLTKFIPAEAVAFFAPMASIVQDRPPLLVTAAVIGLAGTPAYLWISARKLPLRKRPPIRYYVLSSLAFVVWALATSRLSTMLGLDSIATAFMLGLSVFLIPLIDLLFTRPK